jgi:hypothetical protein
MDSHPPFARPTSNPARALCSGSSAVDHAVTVAVLMLLHLLSDKACIYAQKVCLPV